VSEKEDQLEERIKE